MLDWNYYKPAASVQELHDGIVVILSDIGSDISDEVKASMKEVLELGRGNGRIVRNNFDSDANGMAHNFQRGYRDEINRRIKEFGLEGKQAELYCDIALMTFRQGYLNPGQENTPKFYQRIDALLDS